jgi:hypothetical protein
VKLGNTCASIAPAYHRVTPDGSKSNRFIYSLEFLSICLAINHGFIYISVSEFGADVMTAERTPSASTQEYLYRWSLALQSRIFGVPHTLGL